MYLMYYLDENKKRVYTLKVRFILKIKCNIFEFHVKHLKKLCHNLSIVIL